MKISLDNVSLCYRVDPYRASGLKEYALRLVTRQHAHTARKFWALQHVSFSLEKGDMLGIIGKNGAGKSTLLKVISGIMRPAKGTCTIEGKIAALLELSSGFDNDMTVRENTFLRGAFLGYTRAFMHEKYPEIMQFAELGEFQERLFGNLSSGMKSRLAFSIASLVNPDILILDEVLSVGDGAFRTRSENKMREIIDNGTTTLFVSHSLEQVKTMCNKTLWLDRGRQIAFGETQPICKAYEAYLATNQLPQAIDQP